MALPAWPSSLPQHPLQGGFSETLPNLVVRSQTDVGPAKVRPRASAGVTQLTAAFRLTPAQLGVFRSFFATDLLGGAVAFIWAHPITGVSGRFRIVPPPQIEPVAAGLAWHLALTLEQLP